MIGPEVRELLAGQPGGSPVTSLTAAAVRAEDREVLALQRMPGALHSVEDMRVPGAEGPLRARVYRPRPGPLQAVLYFHGGGFVIGGDGYDAPLRDLALASGCLIVAPECRLAPECPFPAACDDARAVARWLADTVRDLGAAEASPAVAGDSSGGNLAALVTQDLFQAGRPPSFQVLIYPMLDATASSNSYREFSTGYGFSAAKSQWYYSQYLPPGTDRRDPRVSPVYSRCLRGLPPTLVVTAECDPLRDEGERYARALHAAGTHTDLRRYAGMIHGFFQMTGALADARQLHADLGHWMRQHAGHSVGRDAVPGGSPVPSPTVRPGPSSAAGGCATESGGCA